MGRNDPPLSRCADYAHGYSMRLVGTLLVTQKVGSEIYRFFGFMSAIGQLVLSWRSAPVQRVPQKFSECNAESSYLQPKPRRSPRRRGCRARRPRFDRARRRASPRPGSRRRRRSSGPGRGAGRGSRRRSASGAEASRESIRWIEWQARARGRGPGSGRMARAPSRSPPARWACRRRRSPRAARGCRRARERLDQPAHVGGQGFQLDRGGRVGGEVALGVADDARPAGRRGRRSRRRCRRSARSSRRRCR